VSAANARDPEPSLADKLAERLDAARADLRARCGTAWTIGLALEAIARLAAGVGDPDLTDLTRRAHGRALGVAMRLRDELRTLGRK
jgi:hypothetical protein